MSTFPKVANIQIHDNVYDIKDNLDRAKYNVEKKRTLDADNKLILNKASLADAITAKGVTTNTSDSLMKMAENISNLTSGDAIAKTPLIGVTSSPYRVSTYSIVYAYPWVSRVGGYLAGTVSSGSGGFKYEVYNTNSEHRTCTIVTRLKLDKTIIQRSATNGQNNLPIIFANCIFSMDVRLDYYKNKLRYKYGTEGVVREDVNIPEKIKMDFYLKLEQIKSSDNVYTVKMYISEPDIDGRPQEWTFLTQDTVTVQDGSSDLCLSMLGIDIKWYADKCVVSDKVCSTSESYGFPSLAIYKNYLKETCMALPDENGIMKVVLGESSLFPME